MMTKEIVLAITLGNNKGNLYGSENDAILFYNLFYSFYKNKYSDICWLEPQILLNNQVIINNLLNLLNNISITKLIIYFSGHGYKSRLNFYNENISNDKFFNLISKKVKNINELIIILDCCYSGSFYTEKKYNNINKITFISACNNKQKSNEGLVDYNKDYFIFKNPQKINNINNIIIGIFSYNFFKLIYNKKIYNPVLWSELKNDIIWKQIEKIANQTITFS